MKIALFLLICNLIFSNDLTLEVKTTKKEFIYVERIVLKYRMKNNTDYNYIHPYEKLCMRDEDGQEYVFTPCCEPETIEIEWPLLKPGEEISGYNILYAKPKAGKYWIYYKMDGEFKSKIDPHYGFFKGYDSKNSRVLREDIKSEEAEIEVKEPEGINKEAYERYLKVDEIRRKTMDVQNPLFWELLEKYPESLYAEMLAVDKILGKNPFIKEWKRTPCEICKGFKERSRAYLEKEEAYRKQMEYIKKEKIKRDILEKVILAHKESEYIIPLMNYLAHKCLELEDYDKGRFYYQEIIKLESKENPEIIKPYIKRAKEYLRCLDEYGLK